MIKSPRIEIFGSPEDPEVRDTIDRLKRFGYDAVAAPHEGDAHQFSYDAEIYYSGSHPCIQAKTRRGEFLHFRADDFIDRMILENISHVRAVIKNKEDISRPRDDED